jgi:magnesium-dependent phosphatase-1
MIVFDLDMCLWHPEMWELSSKPIEPIHGELGDKGLGVIAVTNYKEEVRLHDGALNILQELLKPDYKGCILGLASSTSWPEYASKCLELLEIVPKTSIGSLFDLKFRKIGNKSPLSLDKRSHLKLLHELSGVPCENILYFDDRVSRSSS